MSAEDVKKLREMTGAGVMDSKNALEDADGDFDKAAALIKERGLLKAGKKAGRDLGAGLIDSYVHNDRVGVLVNVSCETDFVARSDDFRNLTHSIAMQVAAMNPVSVSREEISKDIIEKEMSGIEIMEFLDKFPKTFFALTFKTDDGSMELKIQPKAPKSAKPGSKSDKGSDLKINFCKLKTCDSKIADGFVFEKSDWKKAEITHTFFIDEIIIPEEMKNEKDFAKVREAAKRKGRILRVANIDGQEFKSEKEFFA